MLIKLIKYVKWVINNVEPMNFRAPAVTSLKLMEVKPMTFRVPEVTSMSLRRNAHTTVII